MRIGGEFGFFESGRPDFPAGGLLSARTLNNESIICYRANYLIIQLLCGSHAPPGQFRNMQNPRIKVVDPKHVTRVISTLILGFANDPLLRWLWPDPDLYLNVMPRLVRADAGPAFELGTAHMEENYLGAALWIPPGIERDEEELLALDKETIPKEKRDDLYIAIEELEQYRPKEPHWYLVLAAVDPNCQSKGIGTALLEFALSKCDENGSPAFLESSNPRNISLYESQGFKVQSEVKITGGPSLFPMTRKAN
jgi:GNAT superfamily N-acetyltransferase